LRDGEGISYSGNTSQDESGAVVVEPCFVVTCFSMRPVIERLNQSVNDQYHWPEHEQVYIPKSTLVGAERLAAISPSMRLSMLMAPFNSGTA
jgi:hypothetical protein